MMVCMEMYSIPFSTHQPFTFSSSNSWWTCSCKTEFPTHKANEGDKDCKKLVHVVISSNVFFWNVGSKCTEKYLL
jgi:hypothetical protein